MDRLTRACNNEKGRANRRGLDSILFSPSFQNRLYRRRLRGASNTPPRAITPRVIGSGTES
jgi:hypothetical protein